MENLKECGQKDIMGYDYAITSAGRVWSYPKHGRGKRNGIGGWLKLIESSNGYLVVTLYANKKNKRFYVHRLVGAYFIPNKENKLSINHKDGNPKNNNVDNLEWCTQAENIHHAIRTGLKVFTEKDRERVSKLGKTWGKRCGIANRKLSMKRADQIRKMFKDDGYKIKELASINNVSYPTIRTIINNTNYKT